jgi:hypothetical protein
MYDIDLLTSLNDPEYSLIGLVGLYQVNNPEYNPYPPSLLQSRSKRYLQSVHTLISSQAIDQCAENFDHFDYQAYSALIEYQLGDKVRQSGVNYEYINPVPSTGNTPPNSTYWKVITATDDYLLRRQRQAITEVLDECFDEKKVKQITKTVLKEISLFTGVGNVSNLEINRGAMVGLRIKIANSRGLINIVKRIGTQFSGAAQFNIYVYHSSRTEPLFTIPIDHTTANNFQWTEPEELIMRFFSEDHDSGGEFWIGYFQDDLGISQAIKKDYDWSRSPSGSCCWENQNLYKQWSTFISVDPFQIPSGYLNGTDLPNLNYAGFNYSTNYGLNLNLSVQCDLTAFIKEHETLFSRAIALKWGLLQINDMVYSIRGNKISERTKEMARMELDPKKGDSVVNQYRQALKAVSFDFSTLDKVCLPCDNKYGITWKSM